MRPDVSVLPVRQATLRSCRTRCGAALGPSPAWRAAVISSSPTSPAQAPRTTSTSCSGWLRKGKWCARRCRSSTLVMAGQRACSCGSQYASPDSIFSARARRCCRGHTAVETELGSCSCDLAFFSKPSHPYLDHIVRHDMQHSPLPPPCISERERFDAPHANAEKTSSGGGASKVRRASLTPP